MGFIEGDNNSHSTDNVLWIIVAPFRRTVTALLLLFLELQFPITNDAFALASVG